MIRSFTSLALRSPTQRAFAELLEGRRLLSASPAPAAASAMAYDAGGTLHMAYSDPATGSLFYTQRDTSGTWSDPAVIDPGPQVGSSLSIATDPSGHPAIAYYDARQADLKYAHFNGASWDLVRVDTVGKVGQNPSLAFNQAGYPLISYFSQTNGDLKLASFDGAGWTTTIVDRKGTAGQFSSIAIDPVDGTWAIAYGESTKRQVRFASQSARTTLQTSAKSPGWTAIPSLAFSPTGDPAVSFFDPATKSLKLASSSGAWSTRTITTSAQIGPQSQLSFDPVSGQAEILFLDRSIGSINLATAGSNVWSTTTLGAGGNLTAARDPLTNSFTFADSNGASPSLTTALSDPSNLTAAVISNSRIDLTWTDTNTTETGFAIERSTDGGATFAPLVQLPPAVAAYSDTSITDGHAYIYRLKAIEGTSSSHWAGSSVVSIPFISPANVHATVNINGSVHLAWTSTSTGTTGFHVLRSSDGTTFTTLGSTTAQPPQFDDLTAGVGHVWFYRVAPFNLSGDGSPITPIAVQEAPAAPAHLKVYAQGPTIFELQWDPITGAAAHVLVQTRVAGSNTAFGTLATLDADQFSYSVTANTNGSPLIANTIYEFRLIAQNVDGTPSADSNHALGSTGLIAPEGLTAQVMSSTAAGIAWEDNAGAASNYNVYLSTDGTSYTLYSATYLQATTLHLPDLTSATHYWIKVTATDGTHESAPSIIEIDTQPGVPGAAPKNVAVQDSLDNPLNLNISWNNAASDAIGFHIQRSTDGIHFTTIADAPATWGSYDDPSVVEGTYYYRLITFTASGDAGTSATASAAASLAEPTNLHATVITTGAVNLTWNNNSTLATGLQLFAVDAGETPILVDGAILPATTHYTVTQFANGTPLTPGATYWFYLVPTGGPGAMGTSAWVGAVNGFAAPSELSVSATADGELTLNWTDVAGETGYQIESSTDGVHYTNVSTTAPNVTTFVQTGLPETAQLYYRVMALGAGGNSQNVTSARTAVTPNMPTNLIVTPLAGGAFHLTWEDNSSNEDGYAIRVRTANGDTYIPAQLSPNATSATITNADLGGIAFPGHAFTFQVVAIRWWGDASQAAEVQNVVALA